jgi:hypothetical protein
MRTQLPDGVRAVFNPFNNSILPGSYFYLLFFNRIQLKLLLFFLNVLPFFSNAQVTTYDRSTWAVTLSSEELSGEGIL